MKDTKPVLLPAGFVIALALLALLPSVRQNPKVAGAFLGTAGVLGVWNTVLGIRAHRSRRALAIEVVVRKQHYLQACAQGSVLLYWGWYWFHCGQWIEDNEEHDCSATTEEKLTADLSEDLMDAWERLRETASGFGRQRIYASHKSIMFSRKACYFFVRPKKKFLEIYFFLGRAIKHPLIRKTHQSSKAKVAHLVYVTHRDQVESPLTDWLIEAFKSSDALTAKGKPGKKGV